MWYGICSGLGILLSREILSCYQQSADDLVIDFRHKQNEYTGRSRQVIVRLLNVERWSPDDV